MSFIQHPASCLMECNWPQERACCRIKWWSLGLRISRAGTSWFGGPLPTNWKYAEVGGGSHSTASNSTPHSLNYVHYAYWPVDFQTDSRWSRFLSLTATQTAFMLQPIKRAGKLWTGFMIAVIAKLISHWTDSVILRAVIDTADVWGLKRALQKWDWGALATCLLIDLRNRKVKRNQAWLCYW